MFPRFSRRFALSALATLPMAKAQGDIGSGPGRELSIRLQQFLKERQRPDGSWHSDTYGVLRSGQALTPFVLLALLQANPSLTRSVETSRAVDWISRHLREGCLGVADPDVLEYPVYSTSLALRCFVCLNDAGRPTTGHNLRSDIDAMRRYLLGEQYAEPRGFHRDHLAYGGWGFGGVQPPGQTGHMDLAHTRWALQALADADQDPVTGDDPQPGGYRAKAKRLLRLLQKHPSEDRKSPLAKAVTSKPPYDGGFYFSPIVLAANKGRIESQGATKFFRSYATATCDGILALLAAGVPQNDPRVAAAHRWLEQHANWEYPQGIPRDHPEPWADAVFFYHQAVRAEVYRRLAVTGDWPEQLCQRLAPHLRPDGSIINRRSALMKEDDPLLGSTLALMAVTEARRAANGD